MNDVNDMTAEEEEEREHSCMRNDIVRELVSGVQ